MRLKKALKILAIVVVGLIAIALIALHVMMDRYSEMTTVSEIRDAEVQYEQTFVQVGDYQVNAYRIGDISLPKALLVHGSPGHWVDWQSLYTNDEVLSQYCLITFDRPGYGGTTFPATGSLTTQAQIAAEVMNYFCDENECYAVAGHSYGGGVVEQLLLDHSSRVNRGIYVAGTLSPEHQPRKWYNYIASAPPVKWILPKEFNSSNKEMMILGSELKKNEGRQSEITHPIVLIQGTTDVLVPAQTADYYRSVKPEGVRYVIIEGMNHFIPWTDPELIVKALVD